MSHSFDNLPELTDRQAAVVGAMLSPHAAIHEVADATGITLAELFDHLASPAVNAHLDHARKSLDKRLRLRLADAAFKAVDLLEQMVESRAPHGTPEVAPLEGETLAWQVERRRAASTILRAHMAPRTRRPARRSLDGKRLSARLGAIEHSRLPDDPPPREASRNAVRPRIHAGDPTADAPLHQAPGPAHPPPPSRIIPDHPGDESTHRPRPPP